MSTTISLLLLAALPIGQRADSTAPSDLTASRPNRILAIESDTGATSRVTLPARQLQPDDACLCDITFVDARHGWAVGDHGVILHTEDGGRHWMPQESGVVCTLSSVSFIDARNGWAAGGMVWPYLQDTSGVVIATRDGGHTWQREPVLLPALRKIHFVSDSQGWAVGNSSAMYPGGTFLTRDGGRSWQPTCDGGARGLTTGDFYDGHNAILAGALGQMAAISQGEFTRKSHPGTTLNSVQAIQIVPPVYGWLVGDGGWIALTADRGNSWRPPLGKLPACAAMFDFTALAVRGGTCWIAGTPGSRIFSTPDAGRTWLVAPTGVTAPLRAITFIDDQHGWAVGQLGLVIATDDGGRTWQRQRAPAARAALMAVAGMPEDLPLELLARVCKDQGYLGVGEVLGRGDLDAGSASDSLPADRLHQAMLQVGACGGEMAWGFPVREAELQIPARQIMESWNRFHAGHASEALIGHMVRQIRTWRPDVLAISAPRNDGLTEIIRQSAAAAVKLAADPAYLAEQFREAGCEPWSVQRVLTVSNAGSQTQSTLNTEDWSPRLSESWADIALPARGLLQSDDQPGPAAISVQRSDASANLAGPPDIMADVNTSTGGTCRRPMTDAARSPAGTLDGLAQRRQVDMAFAHLEQDSEGFVARLTKGDELPQNIDVTAAAALTFRIAERLRHTGHWELADKVFDLFLQRYENDPLSRWAIVQRLHYLVSGTLRAPMESSPERFADTNQALLFARQIETIRPDLFAAPTVRYPLASVYRSLGQTAQAERLYVLDHRGADRDAWWTCARGERWLLERKGPPPKSLASCPAVTERPHLDGHLDEAIWKKCTPIELKSASGDDSAWPASVRMAHDEQFLYVAIECRQAAGTKYEATSQRRTRDPDLSDHDRIDLFLDIDRSYASHYHLTIDHRGWAADACSGDKSWNPHWFVAAATADGSWTAEAAIPLAELHAAITPGKSVWSLGIQRTVPGVGFQSWTTPAAAGRLAEGFGWLEFE